jgi:hypothetical protein
MEKIARFMEYFWLTLAVLTAVWSIYVIAGQGWAQGKVWLLFPAVCGAMYGYRRFMRGRIERWAEQQQQEKGANGR